MKKIDGILEKSGKKKTVEKTWKKINYTVLGEKLWEKTEKSNVQISQIGLLQVLVIVTVSNFF